jgi:hypothetical protein
MPYAWLPTDAHTRARFFFGSRVSGFWRDPSCHIELLTRIFYKEIYEQKWYWKGLLIPLLEESCKEYLQASQQADSALTYCHEKEPQEPWRTRRPREWDVELSALTHSHHTNWASRQLGTTANRRYGIPRDWLREACQMARVRWGTHCKGIFSKEGPHYWMEWSTGTIWNAIKCGEHLRSCPEAVVRQATINLYFANWKSLEDSFPELYCVDLAEAYVTWENVSS